MGYSRVLRTATSTLEHTFYVDETPTDSTTTVTVSIVDANGTSVTSGNATSAGVGTGKYTFTLPSQSLVNLLTVSWSATIATASVVEADMVEIVGGFFFTLAEGRASDSTLADPGKYPTARLIAKRLETEVECEEICDRSFVPRYRRAVLDGTGTSELMLVGDNDIRAIRAVKVAPQVGEAFVALTAGELAKLVVTPDRVLVRADGLIWTEERANVVVEYEYGLDSPPEDLRRAAMTRFRSRLNLGYSGVQERALSYTTGDGTTYRLSTPDAYSTGLPDVDAVYARWSLRSGVGGSGEDGREVPASRLLNFDPQNYSLFHGGVR